MTADAGAAWRWRSLGSGDAAAAMQVWNATFEHSHPLSERAWAAWWASPDADPALTWGAFEDDGTMAGFLLARAPQRPWAAADLGHVALFAVAPQQQRRGLGGGMWRLATEALAQRGRGRVALGADPERLLPGVPLTAPEPTWRFLRARGALPGALEADLLLDLGPPLSVPPLPPGTELVVDDPAAAIGFVRRAFPGRWADEVQRYADQGVQVLGLRRTGETIGFCVAHRPGDSVLGPGLAWAGGLPGRVAGLGPLGVDPAVRGGGLGLGMTAAAADWQRRAGFDTVLIDWTSLAAFYGRMGAHVWRVYQRMEVTTT